MLSNVEAFCPTNYVFDMLVRMLSKIPVRVTLLPFTCMIFLANT